MGSAPRLCCSVLIVDDNPDDREFYRRSLMKARRADYRVEESADGAAGLVRLHEGAFDCVLLDYSLPGANGLQILREIRGQDRHLPVIMLTGQGDVDVAVNALKEGASDYLAKAADIADRLDQAIRAAVDSAANARRVERSQRYLRQMMDHIPDPIFMKDEAHRWVDGNTAFWSFMGGKPDLFIGQTGEALFPQEVALAMQASETAAFESGKVSVEEERWTGTGGDDRVYLTKRGVFRDSNDRKLLVGVMHDITEARRMDRMKSEFISTVSHELRTPLTSIRGSLGLLMQPFAATLSEAGQQLIDMAAENCERLVALINDILDIDKIASGDMRLDMAAHEVADLVDRAIRATGAYAERFAVALHCGEVPGDCRIDVDEARFQQILSNILSNAIKFSDPGQSVDVSVRKAFRSVRINVADHGPGIPVEFRERIFGRFAQADSSTARAKNGSGLGLHISRQLVEAMGGHIGFTSEVGAGTTFWIEFPRAMSAAATLRAQAVSAAAR